jgi:hypothetical protein
VLTDQRLAEIAARAEGVREYIDLPDDADGLAGEDVPALIAEIRRLQALVTEARADTTGAVCGQCRRPFDPTDTRWDGRAQHRSTGFCRSCTDRCDSSEIADHRCNICR